MSPASFPSYACWYSMKGACGQQDSVDVGCHSTIYGKSNYAALYCIPLVPWITAATTKAIRRPTTVTKDLILGYCLTAGSLAHRLLRFEYGSNNSHVTLGVDVITGVTGYLHPYPGNLAPPLICACIHYCKFL